MVSTSLIPPKFLHHSTQSCFFLFLENIQICKLLNKNFKRSHEQTLKLTKTQNWISYYTQAIDQYYKRNCPQQARCDHYCWKYYNLFSISILQRNQSKFLLNKNFQLHTKHSLECFSIPIGHGYGIRECSKVKKQSDNKSTTVL